MKANELKLLFDSELADEYSAGELRDLFFIFLEFCFGLSKNEFLRDNMQVPTQDGYANFKQCIAELKEHKPYQYITGSSLFYGLELKVTPEVLIPRPETEELVDLICRDGLPGNSLLDIGTGSGCIALAMKSRFPEMQVTGLDVSKGALEIARQNSEELQLPVDWMEFDLLADDFEKLPELEVIVSNPPYIAVEEVLDKRVYQYEPHLALFAEGDALIFYRKIAQLMKSNMKSGGRAYFEINAAKLEETVAVFEGFEVESLKDISGNNRFLVVTK